MYDHVPSSIACCLCSVTKVRPSATQILGRFLNRLPTVTIRAGHRLRVWVTSDFLIPRPKPHPERMYRG